MPNPPPPEFDAPPALAEARYSLKDMLREVEYERRHSSLGMEMVDQSEIGAIFKTRGRRAAARPKAK